MSLTPAYLAEEAALRQARTTCEARDEAGRAETEQEGRAFLKTYFSTRPASRATENKEGLRTSPRVPAEEQAIRRYVQSKLPETLPARASIAPVLPWVDEEARPSNLRTPQPLLRYRGQAVMRVAERYDAELCSNVPLKHPHHAELPRAASLGDA
eukprot:4438534-Heterocapsa_arctica.AAC.1